MNNIKIIICLTIINITALTQNKDNEITNLSKPIQLTEEWQIKVIVQSLITGYGKSFKYLSNLTNGYYSFDIINGKGYFLNIYEDERSKSLTAQIKLIKKQNINGNFELTYNDKDMLGFLNANVNGFVFGNFLKSESIITADNMLVDKVILNGITNIANQKILNRLITRTYAVNQHNENLNLFQLAEDAVVLPYNNGQNTKILAADSRYHSIIYFDKDMVGMAGIPINGFYGHFGTGNNEFANITGLTTGRETQSGFDIYYPIFFADKNNNRITKTNFIINNSTPQLAHFDENTFAIITNEIDSPYDIEYFKSDNSSADKIWFSELYPDRNSLKCIDLNGNVICKIRGFRYENGPGQFYNLYFENSMTPRISVYDEAFRCLALIFANENENSIITFLLNDDGVPSNFYNDSVVYAIREHFNADYHLSSINFHKTSQASQLYPYLWVTSGGYSVPFAQSIDMIHGFAINKNGGFAYLGSTSKPRNTDYVFNNLLNISLNNNYYDMGTIEEWGDNYGMRRYMPFVDLHSESVTNYCTDGIDRMLWMAAFTNDCNIRVRVDKKEPNSSLWQPIEIKKVDGQSPLLSPYYVDIYRQKGWTALSGEDPVDIKVKLPMKDYFLTGTQLKLKVTLFPDYVTPNDFDSRNISREYVVDITRNCITEPVGCPFLYVTYADGDYILDNNILHKSEYSISLTDITDKYKLQVTPGSINGDLELYLTENENDIGYFDQIKLHAVDYPENKIMAVTESNDIVLFDPLTVNSSDNALLNGKTDITNNINFHNPGLPVEGHENDIIDAHFSNLKLQKSTYNKTEKKNELMFIKSEGLGIQTNGIIACIGNLTEPVPAPKERVAVLTATSVLNDVMIADVSRRERPSIIAVPLFDVNNQIDNINLTWDNDFHLKYIGAGNFEYSGYNVTDIPVKNAINLEASSETDVTSSIYVVDNEYGEINANKLLKLIFDASTLPELPPSYKRDYVIEVVGHYTICQIDKSIVNINSPKEFRLYQNYPNPFNPTATIKYELPNDAQVVLKVYDLLGREITTLVSETKKPGYYQVQFEGSNYASGVYFYRIEAGSFVQAKKMILVK